MNKKEKPADNLSSREKKVKRVKTHHARGTNQSVNVDCFKLEEEESEKQNSEEGLTLFQEASAELKKIFKIILAGRAANKTEVDLKNHRTSFCLLLIKMKKLNRLDKHRLKKSRDIVNEKKQKISNLNLQFQNLLYEETHLQKEVTKCLEFRSQDEDIELVPIEEFYKESPVEISKPDITKFDNHKLTLARLHWELEQRKRLAVTLKQAESVKEVCKLKIRKLKECHEKIQPILQNILEATEPLQSKLGMPLQEYHAKHRSAKFLPRALYVLYVETCAYKEACDGKIDIVVEGNTDDAKILQMKRDSIDEDSGESDQEENTNSKRHRHSASKSSEAAGKDILIKHPLSIILTVEGNGGKVCIEFYYLHRLNIVTVSVKGITSLRSQNISDSYLLNPSTLLNCLFSGDNGRESPNPANKYHLQKIENRGAVFSNEKTGWPYTWAQHIAGLSFLSNSTDSPDSKYSSDVDPSYVGKVVHAIRSRITTRISLSFDMSTLVSGSSIPTYITELTNSTKIVSRLKKWSIATWDEVKHHPGSSELLEMNVINEDAIVYKAIIERGSATLDALVLIMPNYPEQNPIFLLFLHWKVNHTSVTNTHLRELEEEINVRCIEAMAEKQKEMLSSGHSDMLFLYQMYHLLACFDVFLETDFSCESIEGPREFIPEKIVTRTFRGRGHSLPFEYLPERGIFTHL